MITAILVNVSHVAIQRLEKGEQDNLEKEKVWL